MSASKSSALKKAAISKQLQSASEWPVFPPTAGELYAKAADSKHVLPFECLPLATKQHFQQRAAKCKAAYDRKRAAKPELNSEHSDEATPEWFDKVEISKQRYMPEHARPLANSRRSLAYLKVLLSLWEQLLKLPFKASCLVELVVALLTERVAHTDRSD